MNSTLYWIFKIKWSWIDLIKNSSPNIYCSWAVNYSFSWTILSNNDNDENLWWELNTINTNNYFCPATWEFNLPVRSDTLWTINFSSDEIVKTITVVNSYWKKIEVDVKNLFDSKKIYINWSYLESSNIDNSSFEWELTKDLNQIKSQLNIDWKITNLDSIIKKNVTILTKNRVPDNTLVLSDWTFNKFNSSEKDFYYYDYKWKVEINNSHLNNKWKILQLWNWWTVNNSTLDFAKIKVDWKNTLIVDWWNLYINADIYNKDKNSILVIVVKRDKTQRKNWWNIYINPNVTNIDAVLIADWSIFNYNWTTTGINTNSLRRQLLIYWAVSTKNTIWEDKAPYWSDDYIEWNWNTYNWKEYNLKYLRNFQATSSDIIAWDCNASSKITALWNSSWIWALKYAFVWKKECFLKDDASSWLRVTDKLSPLVIIYNPLIQIDPPTILKIR